MAEAVVNGARSPDVDGVDVRVKSPLEADAEELGLTMAAGLEAGIF